MCVHVQIISTIALLLRKYHATFPCMRTSCVCTCWAVWRFAINYICVWHLWEDCAINYLCVTSFTVSKTNITVSMFLVLSVCCLSGGYKDEYAGGLLATWVVHCMCVVCADELGCPILSWVYVCWWARVFSMQYRVLYWVGWYAKSELCQAHWYIIAARIVVRPLHILPRFWILLGILNSNFVGILNSNFWARVDHCHFVCVSKPEISCILGMLLSMHTWMIVKMATSG